MTAQLPFGLDQLEMFASLLGDLHYEIDPLNGATDLFCAPDMHKQAETIVAEYARAAWSPRAVRVFIKTNLPAGYIVGLRQPTGISGPFPDTVLLIKPRPASEGSSEVEEAEIAPATEVQG